MDYISTQEAAEKWGLSLRQVQRLLKNQRITGARKYGVSWMIPADSGKPAPSPDSRASGRAKAGKKAASAESICAAYPVLHIHGGSVTGAYKRCQSTAERALLEAWITLFRGDARAAGEMASAIPADARQPFVKLGCGILRLYAAMYAGDPAAWRTILKEVTETRMPAGFKSERELVIASARANLHARDGYPKWLETGALTALNPDLLPVAYWTYTLILYAKYRELDLVAVAEPLIAACHKEQSDVPETYIRLLAAIAYHNRGDKAAAREHIAKAIDIARPLGFIAPFFEYRHMVAEPMDASLKEKWPEALPEIKRRTQPFMEVWARVYTDVMEQPFTNALTQREYEVSLLASRGLTLIDIAARTGLSKNSVKKYLNAAYQKLGVEKRARFAPSSTIRKGRKRPPERSNRYVAQTTPFNCVFR